MTVKTSRNCSNIDIILDLPDPQLLQGAGVSLQWENSNQLNTGRELKKLNISFVFTCNSNEQFIHLLEDRRLKRKQS